MGSYLAKPVLDRSTEQGANTYVAYGSSAVQGWRYSQEDAHINTLDLVDGISMFAVFDGHGGCEVARYCASALPIQLLMQPAFYKRKDISKALYDAFFQVDKNILTKDVKALLQQISLSGEQQRSKKKDPTKTNCFLECHNDSGNKYSSNFDEIKYNQSRQRSKNPVASILNKNNSDDETGPMLFPEFKVLKRGRAMEIINRNKLTNSRKLREQYQKEAIESDPNEDDAIVVRKCVNYIVSFALCECSDDNDENNDSCLFEDPEFFNTFAESISSVDGYSECWKDGSNVNTALSNSADYDDDEDDLSTSISDTSESCTEHSSLDDESMEVTKKRPSSDIADTIKDVIKLDVQSTVQSVFTSNKQNMARNNEQSPLTVDSHKQYSNKQEGLSADELSDENERKKPRRCVNVRTESKQNCSSKDIVDQNDAVELLNGDHCDELFSSEDNASCKNLEYKDNDAKSSSTPSHQSEDSNDLNEPSSLVLSESEAIQFFREMTPLTFLCSTKSDPGINSGCTAIVAVLVENRRLFVANAGDSRGVLCRRGQAIALSEDHSPEVMVERMRITNAGHRVTSDGRVDRGLNLSRSIGDHSYKNNDSLPADMQAITCKPDICVMDIQADDDFFVLACDGIWNCKSNQQVCDMIKEALPHKSLGQICEDICSRCIALSTDGDGSGCDNMTIVIVQFKHFLSHDNEDNATSQAFVHSTSNVNSSPENGSSAPTVYHGGKKKNTVRSSNNHSN